MSIFGTSRSKATSFSARIYLADGGVEDMDIFVDELKLDHLEYSNTEWVTEHLSNLSGDDFLDMIRDAIKEENKLTNRDNYESDYELKEEDENKVYQIVIRGTLSGHSSHSFEGEYEWDEDLDIEKCIWCEMPDDYFHCTKKYAVAGRNPQTDVYSEDDFYGLEVVEAENEEEAKQKATSINDMPGLMIFAYEVDPSTRLGWHDERLPAR